MGLQQTLHERSILIASAILGRSALFVLSSGAATGAEDHPQRSESRTNDARRIDIHLLRAVRPRLTRWFFSSSRSSRSTLVDVWVGNGQRKMGEADLNQTLSRDGLAR